jgi:acetyl esterase/lipase
LTPRHRARRAGRRLLAAVAAVLTGVLAAVVLYQTSLQPGAAITRAVFDKNVLVTPPPGFGQIERAVTMRRVPIALPGAPDAHLDIFTPDATTGAARPVILWVHGGGFISSSATTVYDYTVLLAYEGYTVASLDYSLAPEFRYPVPVRQGNAALQFLRTHAGQFGGDPARIVIGGDSAGAQIASELAAVQTNAALARAIGLRPALAPADLRAVVLYCGLYDMRTVGGTGFPALRTYLWAYTGVRNWTSFAAIDQLSTTQQVTSAYPATFLSVGDADPFRTQSAELAAALRTRHVPLTTLFWTGSSDHLPHEYQFDFQRPQARTAWQQMLSFLHTTTKG